MNYEIWELCNAKADQTWQHKVSEDAHSQQHKATRTFLMIWAGNMVSNFIYPTLLSQWEKKKILPSLT